MIAGDGKRGIAVGLEKEFPSLAPVAPLASADPTRREDYVLRTHPGGVAVLGASELAAEDAVWDLLYRVGYRQFFPGAHWEVIPQARTLDVALDDREHPAYFARRIWYGYGLWDYNKAPYAEWCAKNRATSGIEVASGHVYDAILRANKAEFERHPEYLGLYQGKRQSTKFCISNPGLRKLVVADALRRLERDPAADSVSMEPSDGGKWCECAECAKLGSVTDRALLLANEVAAAVAAKYPGKYVGMYAYNFHPMNAGMTELWQLYFYVPKGTREVVLFGGEHGDVCDSQMRPLLYLNGREPNYTSVKVPEGEDGKLWCLRNSKGPKMLLTVPPYFARTPKELLLPAEVVAKDEEKLSNR